jgi:carbamoyl-phosphate synthase large subunit
MNILLTSVGRRSYLVNYFKKALNGDGEVHVMNSSKISPAFLVADKATVSPLIYDKDYIPFLVDYCKGNHIKAIISCLDIDLPILARNKEKFNQIGTKVVVADPDFIEACNDKWKTYQFLTANGFLAPKTYVSLSDAEIAIQNGALHFPVMIKPRWGMGSIAVYEAETEEELKVLYEKTKRKLSTTYLKYESAADMDAAVLIQEKIDGQEYGLDIMNDLNGSYMNTSVKMKYAMRSGETDCAITVDDPKARVIGKKISGLSHHPGNLDCDVFVADGEYYVLEMNARFGGGYPFSHIAGVDLPKAIVMWLKGEEVPIGLLEPRIGVMGQKDITMVILDE